MKLSSENTKDLTKMNSMECDNPGLFEHFALIQQLKDEREEILRLKWLESEKAQQDIGFQKALLHWIIWHRSQWLEKRRHHLP